MMMSKVNPFVRDAALARLMSGKGVTVVIQGDACPATDGKIVVVPPLKMGADEVDVAIHDHGVSHEPAHVTEGTFDGPRLSGFLHDIQNFLEDARVEDSQERTKYPGLRHERARFYEEFHKYAVRMGTAKLMSHATGANVVRGALCLLLLRARCLQLGVQTDARVCRVVREFYDKVLARHERGAATSADAKETATLATQIHRDITAAVSSGMIGQIEAEAKKDQQGGGGGRNPFAGERDPSAPKADIKDLEDNGAASISNQILATISEGGGSFVPENQSDHVVTASPNARPRVEQIAAQGVAMLGCKGAEMTRLFVANNRPRTVHARLDGRLDCRAMTGDPLDVRREVYCRRIRGSVDRAAVSFLYDVSGTMKNSVYSVAQVVMGLAHYLDKAGIPFEVNAFSDDYFRVKKWSEPWKGEPFLRCSPFTQCYTVMGSAFRTSARSLMSRPEGKKVFVVLGDGAPSSGYDESEYCRRTAETMRRHGAVVIGIGIDCNLSHIFGEDHITLPADNMGPWLVKRLTEILNRKAPCK